MLSTTILSLSLLSSAAALRSGPPSTHGLLRPGKGRHGIQTLDNPSDNATVFHVHSLQQISTYNDAFYFDQLIDHNNPSKGTFKQRYYHNYEYYDPGGPVVLMTPGETDASGFTGYLTNSTVPGKLAELLNGTVVMLEHRFFGKSQPTGDLSTDSLRLHTIQQAIDDIDYFARTVVLPQPENATLGPDKTAWIMVGGSYPGALTSYVMQNKPDLLYAGWASSGVVQAIGDFWGYYEPERQYMPKNCSADMTAVIDYVDSVFETGTDEEIWAMKQNFGLGDLVYGDDFAEALSNTPGSWQGDISAVYDFCDYIETSNGKKAPATGWGLDHAFKAWGTYWNETLFPSSTSPCIYSACGLAYIHDATVFNWAVDTAPDDDRSWTWMTCNEFGFSMTGAPADHPSLISRQFTPTSSEARSLPSLPRLILCSYRFPDTFSGTNASLVLNALSVNSRYWGWNVTTPRLVFVNGEQDPWREATVGADGANPSFDSALQPHLMHDMFHCSDLIFSAGNTDKMREVQKEALEVIVGWMQDWRPSNASSSSSA
ncbi:peptidase S28 [Epithele typhae]|uniref:peptidase S28 n=1 Tax=Epithele typhae TaxID=378194 RepID=UPI002008919F|nr:peptidase S28 [Epithele typhae]KAH9936834.1 peptidase S28 [Epithele typhae]